MRVKVVLPDFVFEMGVVEIVDFRQSLFVGGDGLNNQLKIDRWGWDRNDRVRNTIDRDLRRLRIAVVRGVKLELLWV